MKSYVVDAIKDAIGDEITHVNGEIERFQSQQRTARPPAQPSASEAKASEADPSSVRSCPFPSRRRRSSTRTCAVWP